MAHVLVLPWPNQGHINPMLQFTKRLVSKGPHATLVTTLFIIKSLQVESGSIGIAPISDGYDDGGLAAAPSLEDYFASLEEVGARTLHKLIENQRNSGRPFTCMVYDTYVPWAVKVAKGLGLPAVAYSTQSCAVGAIYYYVKEGKMGLPEEGSAVSMEGLPEMERCDFPSFAFRDGSYPALTGLSLNQFSVEKIDWVLFNSFDVLESKVISCLKNHWHARTVGPAVPSMLVDKRVQGNDSYDMNLLKPEADACMKWLHEKPSKSVVYVSFGSFATLGEEQMEELAWGLKESNKLFLWVVRASEQKKLPPELILELREKQLVVSWSPQLAVLTHEAVGCFVTHCGWNSTLEALSLGVPMVAVPQWTDQTTNAKYVEDVWGVGVRVKVGENKIIHRGEFERCIREVMDGERSEEIRRNARWWRDMTREALDEGGSSDENLNEFVDYLNDKANEVLQAAGCRLQAG